MSTKIFDGYLIEQTSLPVLNSCLKEITAKLQETIDKVYFEEVAMLGTLILDYRTIGKCDDFIKDEIYMRYNLEIKESVTFRTLLNNLLKKDTNAVFIDDIAFDFKVNIILYPLEDKTLIRIVTNKEFLTDKLTKKFKFLKEYSYWDNTDKPKKITENNWDKRREDWDLAIENNLNLKIQINESSLFEKANFSKLESLSEKLYETRLNRLIEDIIYSNYKYNGNPEDENIMTSMSKSLREYKKSEQFKIDFSNANKKAISILPKKYEWREFIRIKI